MFVQSSKPRCASLVSRLKETVNETLRVGLVSRQKSNGSKPFKVRPKAMGLKPGYSYDKVWELIEQVEGLDYK